MAWTVVEGPHGQWVDTQGNTHTTTESGYCDSTTKTIFLNYGQHGRQQGRTIIIHEIVHAVTSGAHGTQFCARLRQAAQRASDLGDMTLSAQWRAEAEAYESPGLSLGSPYRRIPQIVCENPGATFEQILTYLADEYVETAPALVARYPRLHAVYQRARHQEITTLRSQRKRLRIHGGVDHMLTYVEELLRLLEAVPDDPTPPTTRPRSRKAAPVG
jgi:hypothetical protein